MKRDFDFVTMSDYQADMKESSEQAAHTISLLRAEADFWQDAFWRLVEKNGGARLYVTDLLQRARLPNVRLKPGREYGYHVYDDTHEFKVVPSPTVSDGRAET